MRIISGLLKGKTLISPNGQNTRPTSDKARQGVFNILEHAPWSNGIREMRFLDICAGTGAFGLEAISRGAKYACFIENNRDAIFALKQNIKNCGFDDKSKIIEKDARKIDFCQNPFDIIFIDPPYKQDLLPAILRQAVENNYINTKSIVIIEHHRDENIELQNDFELLKQVNYGINGINFLRLN